MKITTNIITFTLQCLTSGKRTPTNSLDDLFILTSVFNLCAIIFAVHCAQERDVCILQSHKY